MVGTGFDLPMPNFACESGVACYRSVAEAWGVVGGRLGDAEAPKASMVLCTARLQACTEGELVQAVACECGKLVRSGWVHGVGGSPRYVPKAVRANGRPLHRPTKHVKPYDSN